MAHERGSPSRSLSLRPRGQGITNGKLAGGDQDRCFSNRPSPSKRLFRQPGGFEGRLAIGGYRDAPDLVVLDRDDGVCSQAQLEATAATLPKSGSDAHEPPSRCADEFQWLQVEVPE